MYIDTYTNTLHTCFTCYKIYQTELKRNIPSGNGKN